MAILFPHIDPIALEIGPLVIRWYALAYLAGFMGGWWYAGRLSKLSPKRRPHEGDLDEVVTWMVLGVILGGRLGYVLFYNASYYFDNPLEILKIWQGGMAFHGGLIGASASMILFSIRKKIPIFQLSDIVSVCAPIGLFFGRIANFINAELYGRVTTMPWGVSFPSAPDRLPRHPSQLYEAFLEGLVLFIILNVLYRRAEIRNRPGIISGCFLAGYGVFRFIVEFFRAPDAHLGLLSLGMSMGQILSLPMILIGAAIIIYVQRNTAKNH